MCGKKSFFGIFLLRSEECLGRHEMIPKEEEEAKKGGKSKK
jgi:hypothetical protein